MTSMSWTLDDFYLILTIQINADITPNKLKYPYSKYTVTFHDCMKENQNGVNMYQSMTYPGKMTRSSSRASTMSGPPGTFLQHFGERGY